MAQEKSNSVCCGQLFWLRLSRVSRLFQFRRKPLESSCSAAEIAPPRKVRHLVVLQHGFGGNASDWSFFAEALNQLNIGSAWMQSTWSDEKQSVDQFLGVGEHVQVTFWAASYEDDDGIEAVGKRLAEGILVKRDEYAKLGEPIKYLSVLGHSMGGLFLRSALKLLYEKGALADPECARSHSEGFVIYLRNFFTVASPHLSVWRPNSGPVDLIFNGSTSAISYNQCIKEVSLNDARFHPDADSAKQPLLYRMATEEGFTKPLGLFKRGVLYANIFGDLQIPYESAALQILNPYKGSECIELTTISSVYPHIANIGYDSQNCFVAQTTREHCENASVTSQREPYWISGETGIGDMYNGLKSIKFESGGWQHCDVNIDGAFRMHFNHWLILGMRCGRGMYHVTDPAMHIMQNLILGDDQIKNSKHAFEVVIDQ